MSTITRYAQSNAVITTGWTNPTYAYADDGVNYATSAPIKNSGVITDFYNFNFEIPTGSTINSITIEMQVKASTTASIATCTLRAVKNTTLMGTEITTPTTEPTTDTVYNGTNVGTWTLSELNNNTQSGGFKIRLSGKRGASNTAVTWSCDYVKVTIDYTLPLPTITIQSTTKTKISDETGMTTTTVTFQSNLDLTAWEARADGTGQGSGTLVGSGGSLTALTNQAFDVDYTELSSGDKTYRINVYGQNGSGWSVYE